MTKVTLTDLANLQNETTAVNAINSNNAVIETAFDNTLSRDGTQPNKMGSTLDMDSHHIVNLPTPGGDFEPLRLKDLNDFNGGGSIIVTNLPTGGAKNSILKKNSPSDYDVTWAYDVGYQYNPYNYGAIGDGVADDYNAINNCITAARTANKTMVLTDGTFAHSASINWAWQNFEVLAIGENVKFKHTGSGVGHNFNGMTNYPGSQGCSGGSFGGPGRILLEGNINTTNLILFDNWHMGYVKIAGKHATNAIVLAQNTGIVGASAVETTFDIKISTNYSGAFTIVPWYGLLGTQIVACDFPKLIVESVGNVANATAGVSLVDCIGNVFTAGTVESCLAGGISMNSGCSRNTFIGMHCEVNGTQQDWVIAGHNNILIGCAGAGTTSGNYLSGNFNTFEGGKWQSMAIQPGASGNTFRNVELVTGFTDGGDHTTIVNPDSIFTAQDYSTAVLGNKTFNTANTNLLKINSKTVTDLSGTGTILPTTVSPTFVTPVLGTPTSGVLTNATGYTATNLVTTATNDNAASGKLGEIIEATLGVGSATALTASTDKTIISISLTAGDWDVRGMVYHIPAATTSITSYRTSISLVNNTTDTTPGREARYIGPAVVPGGGYISMTAGPTRISLASPTTVYLVTNATFTVSTMTAYGYIGARRVR